MRAERMGIRRYRDSPPDLSRAATAWLHPEAVHVAWRYLEAAERIIAGRFDLFSIRDVQLGSPPRWNCDPKSGIEAPLEFGKLLDYRDPRLVGDIKYLWEPNRHFHLVTLAQAYALSREPRYGETLLRHLVSWFEECPYGLGPNWSSALEAGMRLINWSHAWQLLGGASSALFAGGAGRAARTCWLRSIRQHVHFVRGFLSLHSSANNHLIGEATGVFVAACTWPHWPETARWATESRELLVREALVQNAADGVNREQASGYHLFVLDLLLLARIAGTANGHSFPAEFDARLAAMLEYLASVTDAGGNLPMFGDSDDAGAVSLALAGEPGFNPARSLLATGAVLLHRADLRNKAVRLDDRTRWLVGHSASAIFHKLDHDVPTTPPRRAFPAGGYYVLGCDFESDREIRLVADAGPLGYGELAAHGHADALSFTLSVGGCEILVDPGTYTYQSGSRWRDYFRGTSAHNTLRIDGCNQADSGGNFLWLNRPRASCTAWLSGAEFDVFEGRHDGYTRLADPVVHHRRISLDKPARRVLIEDRLEMSGTHRVELFFHCSDGCAARHSDGLCLLESAIGRIRLRLPALTGARAVVCRGRLEPPLGWISRRFDQLVPASTIAWQADITGPAQLLTSIDC